MLVHILLSKQFGGFSFISFFEIFLFGGFTVFIVTPLLLTNVRWPSPYFLIAIGSAKGPLGAGPRFGPWTYRLAGRRANHWATPHPALSNASPLTEQHLTPHWATPHPACTEQRLTPITSMHIIYFEISPCKIIVIIFCSMSSLFGIGCKWLPKKKKGGGVLESIFLLNIRRKLRKYEQKLCKYLHSLTKLSAFSGDCQKMK